MDPRDNKLRNALGGNHFEPDTQPGATLPTERAEMGVKPFRLRHFDL